MKNKGLQLPRTEDDSSVNTDNTNESHNNIRAGDQTETVPEPSAPQTAASHTTAPQTTAPQTTAQQIVKLSEQDNDKLKNSDSQPTTSNKKTSVEESDKERRTSVVSETTDVKSASSYTYVSTYIDGHSSARASRQATGNDLLQPVAIDEQMYEQTDDNAIQMSSINVNTSHTDIDGNNDTESPGDVYNTINNTHQSSEGNADTTRSTVVPSVVPHQPVNISEDVNLPENQQQVNRRTSDASSEDPSLTSIVSDCIGERTEAERYKNAAWFTRPRILRRFSSELIDTKDTLPLSREDSLLSIDDSSVIGKEKPQFMMAKLRGYDGVRHTFISEECQTMYSWLNSHKEEVLVDIQGSQLQEQVLAGDDQKIIQEAEQQETNKKKMEVEEEEKKEKQKDEAKDGEKSEQVDMITADIGSMGSSADLLATGVIGDDRNTLPDEDTLGSADYQLSGMSFFTHHPADDVLTLDPSQPFITTDVESKVKENVTSSIGEQTKDEPKKIVLEELESCHLLPDDESLPSLYLDSSTDLSEDVLTRHQLDPLPSIGPPQILRYHYEKAGVSYVGRMASLPHAALLRLKDDSLLRHAMSLSNREFAESLLQMLSGSCEYCGQQILSVVKDEEPEKQTQRYHDIFDGVQMRLMKEIIDEEMYKKLDVTRRSSVGGSSDEYMTGFTSQTSATDLPSEYDLEGTSKKLLEFKTDFDRGKKGLEEKEDRRYEVEEEEEEEEVGEEEKEKVDRSRTKLRDYVGRQKTKKGDEKTQGDNFLQDPQGTGVFRLSFSELVTDKRDTSMDRLSKEDEEEDLKKRSLREFVIIPGSEKMGKSDKESDDEKPGHEKSEKKKKRRRKKKKQAVDGEELEKELMDLTEDAELVEEAALRELTMSQMALYLKSRQKLAHKSGMLSTSSKIAKVSSELSPGEADEKSKVSVYDSKAASSISPRHLLVGEDDSKAALSASQRSLMRGESHFLSSISPRHYVASVHRTASHVLKHPNIALKLKQARFSVTGTESSKTSDGDELTLCCSAYRLFVESVVASDGLAQVDSGTLVGVCPHTAIQSSYKRRNALEEAHHRILKKKIKESRRSSYPGNINGKQRGSSLIHSLMHLHAMNTLNISMTSSKQRGWLVPQRHEILPTRRYPTHVFQYESKPPYWFVPPHEKEDISPESSSASSTWTLRRKARHFGKVKVHIGKYGSRRTTQQTRTAGSIARSSIDESISTMRSYRQRKGRKGSQSIRTTNISEITSIDDSTRETIIFRQQKGRKRSGKESQSILGSNISEITSIDDSLRSMKIFDQQKRRKKTGGESHSILGSNLSQMTSLGDSLSRMKIFRQRMGSKSMGSQSILGSRITEVNKLTLPDENLTPFSATRQPTYNIVRKFYEDGSLFLVLFPDGTGTIFYPSGQGAITISVNDSDVYTYIAHNEQGEVTAVFETTGYGSSNYDNTEVRICFDQIGGVELAPGGARCRKWMWDSPVIPHKVAPLNPISYNITPHIALRLSSQDHVLLIYRYGTRSFELEVGSKLKPLHKHQQLPVVEPDKAELYIEKTRARVQICLENLSRVLEFPNCRRLEQLSLPDNLQHWLVALKAVQPPPTPQFVKPTELESQRTMVQANSPEPSRLNLTVENKSAMDIKTKSSDKHLLV